MDALYKNVEKFGSYLLFHYNCVMHVIARSEATKQSPLSKYASEHEKVAAPCQARNDISFLRSFP